MNITSVIHLDGPDKSGKDAIKRELIRRTDGNAMVVARSFLSQLVYAKIYNREINFDQWMLNAHDAFQRGEILIYLRPQKNLEKIKERFVEHNEKDMVFDDYLMHRNWFDQFAGELQNKKCRYIPIDTTDLTIDQCCDIIIHRALEVYTKLCTNCLLHTIEVNKMEAKEGHGKLVPMFNGSVDFMVVGLNPSNKRIPYNYHPFELTKHPDTHKNKALWEAFEKLNIKDRVYITNAVKCSTKNNKLKTVDFRCCEHILRAEIEFMRPKTIVAVGNDVFSYIKKIIGDRDINVFNIHHPAYQYAYNQMTYEEYVSHVIEQFTNNTK